jgi:hypothetical protein
MNPPPQRTAPRISFYASNLPLLFLHTDMLLQQQLTKNNTLYSPWPTAKNSRQLEWLLEAIFHKGNKHKLYAIT